MISLLFALLSISEIVMIRCHSEQVCIRALVCVHAVSVCVFQAVSEFMNPITELENGLLFHAGWNGFIIRWMCMQAWDGGWLICILAANWGIGTHHFKVHTVGTTTSSIALCTTMPSFLTHYYDGEEPEEEINHYISVYLEQCPPFIWMGIIACWTEIAVVQLRPLSFNYSAGRCSFCWLSNDISRLFINVPSTECISTQINKTKEHL